MTSESMPRTPAKVVSAILLSVAAFLVFCIGCVTTGPIDKARVPAKILERFSRCTPQDGGLFLRYFSDGIEVGGANLDWKSDSAGKFEAEVVDIVGRPLIALQIINRSIFLSGSQTGTLPKIEVAANHMIEIDGIAIGIRVSELPCLLSFRLPLLWDQYIAGYERDGARGASLSIRDDDRQIEIWFPDEFVYKESPFCANISWKSFFGLRRDSIQWCVKPGPRGLSASIVNEDGKTFVQWEPDGT